MASQDPSQGQGVVPSAGVSFKAGKPLRDPLNCRKRDGGLDDGD